MKRTMFVFAMALLFALPSVSAAKDWKIDTGDWRFALFPESIVPNLKPGDNIDILGQASVINGLGIKGEIRIAAAGVNIYTDAGILIPAGAKLIITGEPLPARPVNIFGPFSPETKARRGEAKPMSDESNDQAGFRVEGEVGLNNATVSGFKVAFDVRAGSKLNISNSVVVNNYYGIRTGVGSATANRIVELVSSTFENRFRDNPNTPAADITAWTVPNKVKLYAKATVFKGRIDVGSDPEDGQPGEYQAIFEDCEILNPPKDWVKQQQLGYVVVRTSVIILGDFDNNQVVDFSDFFAFAMSFGSKQGDIGWDAKFDLDKSGAVDFDDFFIFAANFGKSANVAAKKPVGLLGLNSPNPFNPSTTIPYVLLEDTPVLLRVFNINGQVVRTLVNEHQAAGRYSVRWDGKDESGRETASGVYLFRLEAGPLPTVRKVTLLK